MKNNFKPRLFYEGGGSGGAGGFGAALSGSTPWGAIIQGGAGLIQSIAGGIQAHKAQKDLEKLVAGYKPNSSIMDYYSKALNRYNANPYTSPLYNNQSQQIQRGTAQGLQSFQDRRSANAGISTLIQNQNDSLLKAGAAAQSQQGQELSQLGQATNMKAQEEKVPFQLKYGLLSQKASGGSQIANSGLSNIFGAGNTLSQLDMLKKFYQ